MPAIKAGQAFNRRSSNQKPGGNELGFSHPTARQASQGDRVAQKPAAHPRKLEGKHVKLSKQQLRRMRELGIVVDGGKGRLEDLPGLPYTQAHPVTKAAQLPPMTAQSAANAQAKAAASPSKRRPKKRALNLNMASQLELHGPASRPGVAGLHSPRASGHAGAARDSSRRPFDTFGPAGAALPRQEARASPDADDPAGDTQWVQEAPSNAADSGSEQQARALDPTDSRAVASKYSRQARNDLVPQLSDANTAHGGSKAASREERRRGGSQASNSSGERLQDVQLPSLSGHRQSVQQHQPQKSHYSHT